MTRDPDPPTSGLDAEREAILRQVEAGAAEVVRIAHWMAEHPELALAEVETSARYRRHLTGRGFHVEAGAAGMETAFVAQWGDPDAPFCAALLAEMDALPEIGHACGHNLSGPASLLAAEALARTLPATLLQVRVVGTPAEEIGVGKRRLVEAGCFSGVDVALMAHASDMRRAHRLFLGNRKLELIYRGRAAHAAAYPEQGINALDAVVGFYTAVGLLRQQLPHDVRVHVVIHEGGQAPNVIPERAAARVWVRALDDATLADASERVEACARGAAEATGAHLEIVEAGGTSPPMRANPALAACYRRQLERLGLAETDHEADAHIGSSDITHVARVVPTIHPNFPIGTHLQLHTREFEAAARSPAGEAGLLEAARALALSIHELARSPELRARVASFADG
jgi:amidohydrolase